MEAEVYFDRGIEMAEQLADLPALIRMLANRAEPLIHVGELARAEASLTKAARLVARIDDSGARVDIARFRAVIAQHEDDFQAADRHLTAALTQAVGEGLKLERAESLEEIARLRHRQNRIGDALSAAEAAGELFASLSARRDLARVEALLEEWSSD